MAEPLGRANEARSFRGRWVFGFPLLIGLCLVFKVLVSILFNGEKRKQHRPRTGIELEYEVGQDLGFEIVLQYVQVIVFRPPGGIWGVSSLRWGRETACSPGGEDWVLSLVFHIWVPPVTRAHEEGGGKRLFQRER